jgi:heptosyltransferase-2
VALAPGGAKNILRDDALRRWPIGHYVRLAELLLKEGKEVLLTGGPSDDWVRESFKDLKARDLVGRTDLTDLVALYGQCQVVVTHDSGPMHLAALAGTPVVGLFGPTRPDEKVPPDGPIHVLWGGEHLTCRPCYDGKNYADCLNNECMKSIGPERVLQEVQAVLAGK